MLRTLARPLMLARYLPRGIKHAIEQANVGHCIGALVAELAGAERVLTTRLRACGVLAVREHLQRKPAQRPHVSRAHAPTWLRSFVSACQGCGQRLCGVFQRARFLADRETARLAYNLLRTLEKELSILRYRHYWA